MGSGLKSYISSNLLKFVLSGDTRLEYFSAITDGLSQELDAGWSVAIELDTGEVLVDSNLPDTLDLQELTESYRDILDASGSGTVVDPAEYPADFDGSSTDPVLLLWIDDVLIAVSGIDMAEVDHSTASHWANTLSMLYQLKIDPDAAHPLEDDSTSYPSDGSALGWHLDMETETLQFSAGARDIFDPSVIDELDESKKYLEFVHEDDVENVRRHWERGLETGSFESYHRLELGGTTYHGRAVGVVDSSQSEAIGLLHLSAAGHRGLSDPNIFRELVDHSMDGLYVIDRNTAEIIDVNRRASELIGYSRDELLGRSVMDINPEFSAELFEELKEKVREDGSQRIETTHERKDGSTFPVEIEVSYVQLDQEYHVATVRDITERKRRQAELEAAEARYRTLIETAPDGIFVADADNSELIDVNGAAASLVGKSSEDLEGTPLYDIVPSRHREWFEQAVSNVIGRGRIYRRYEDGTQMVLQSTEGDEIPVSISCNIAELDAQRVLFLVIRDISEQLEYEETLERLNKAGQNLSSANSELEIAQIAVETAAETLGLPDVAIYRFDPEDYVLRPQATSPDILQTIDEPPVIEPESAIAWDVYMSEETAIFDDVSQADNLYNPETPYRSEVIVPIEDYGVIIIGDERPNQFDSRTVDLVEILASSVATAFERQEQVQRLKENEQMLKKRTESLERVEELNTQIRKLSRSLVQAETRAEVEAAVTTHLIDSPAVGFAWLGTFDPIDGRLQPQSWNGDERGYLDAVSFSLESEDATEPSLRTYRAHEPVYVENLTSDTDSEPWRREATRRSFKSVLSVPLIHRNVLRGVLSVYATEIDAFDEEFRSVIAELGTTVAYSLSAINRKQALVSNQATEIDYSLDDPRCFFLRAAEASGCEIELDGLIPQEDDGTLAFVRITDGEIGNFTAYLEQSTLVKRYRVLEERDNPLVQLRIDGPFIGTELAEYGLTLKQATADTNVCQLTVSVPPTIELNHSVDIIETYFEGATPVGKREKGLTESTEATLSERYLGKLTDRQREAVELAFRSGYFDTPKRATGAELAEDMGISHSALHNHLRTAERKLFEELFQNLETLPNE